MKRLLVSLAVAAGAIVAIAGPAAADSVTVRSVDARAMPNVTIVAAANSSSPVDPSSVSVRENGQPVSGLTVEPISQSAAKIGVVLVLDSSNGMRTNDHLTAVKAAAKQFVASKPANEQVAIIAAGDPARVVIPFTSDPALIDVAIDAVGPAGARALWSGVSLADGLVTANADLQGSVVLMTGGTDAASQLNADGAADATIAAKATLYTIGLKGADGIDLGSLTSIATRTGGAFEEASDNDALAGSFGRVQDDINRQYVITYTSTATNSLDLSVKVGATSAHAIVTAGTLSSGANTNPPVVAGANAPGFLRSGSGKWIATGLVLAAAALLAIGVILLVVRDNENLDVALRPYSEDAAGEESADDENLVFETGIMRRAVDTTARLAGHRGVLDKAEQKLEQAAVPLRAAEALFFWLAALMLGLVLGLILAGLFGAAIAAFALGVGPVAVLNQLASKRKRKFVSQLPDALQLLASTLRAGYSLLQGVDAVSQQVADPMGTELRRVLVEARLGRPLEEALQEAADRMGSADFDWAVMAVRVQREVGGNLAELLDTVGETMVQRERLRRDVKSLTAEGRMSAILLGFLPPGVGFMMYTLNPGYLSSLFKDSLGKTMLVGAAVLLVAGFLWMKKMIEIEA